MRVTCPQCQCKGLIDTAPFSTKASLVCIRCGATYEASLVDGEVETALVAEQAIMLAVELEAQPRMLPEACAAPEADEVLDLSQVAELPTPAQEAVAVLELGDAAQPEQEVEAEPARMEAPVQMLRAQAEPDEQPNPTLADSGSFQMPPEYAPQLNRAELARPGTHDKYSLGVRLMRVSPLWLLVCGLAFIAIVVALNGMTGSAEQLSSAVAAAPDRTNTSDNQAPNPGAHNQPTAQTAPVSAAKPAPPTPAEPRTTPAAIKPVEVKPAPTPAPVVVRELQTQSATSGKFTLQVGSFNNTVEANEHAARLQAAGFAAQVVAVELPKRGTWYRVQTGRFADRAEAARYGAQLRAKGAADNFLIAEVAAH